MPLWIFTSVKVWSPVANTTFQFIIIIIHSLELFTSALADGFFFFYFTQLWIKQYHYCSTRRMASALNNLKRVDMPLKQRHQTKETDPLVTVPNAPITIGIIFTCMFHSFFQFPSTVEVLILLFTFFQFYSVVSRDSKVDYFASSLFFCWLLLSLVFWPGLGDPFVC